MPSPSYVPVIRSSTQGNFSVGGSVTVQGNALGDVHPANHSLVAYAYDPITTITGTVLSSGTVYLTAVYPAVNATINNIWWHVATAGVTPTAGQNFVGLYDSTGTLLANTNVDSVITATGVKKTTISPVSVTAGQMYWIGWVFNAGTIPGMPRTNNINGAADICNVGLTPATARFATNGSGLTALPANITPANNVNGLAYWAGIGV
jgi:hypothetical protein